MNRDVIKDELLELLKFKTKTEVAKSLGVSRKTLYKYIDRLGIKDQIDRYNKNIYIKYLETKISELKSNQEA